MPLITFPSAGRSVALALFASVLGVSAVHAVVVDTLASTAPVLNEQFGYALAADGGFVVVGAPGENGSAGAVFAFDCSTGTCGAALSIAPVDLAPGDQFGAAVALSGNTLVVGAPSQGAGAAYVFVHAGAWTQQAKLTASDGVAADRFGGAVAIDASSALVGAARANSERGAAYVFVRGGTVWTQQAKLLAADGSAGDRFGGSVALSVDSALVGAALEGHTTSPTLYARGAAYVFTRGGATWAQQAKLLAPSAAAGDLFGYAVALRGDRALVGAPFATTAQGSARVFERSGASWIATTQLAPSMPLAGQQFGWSVALTSDTALIGAPLSASAAGGNCGLAFRYRVAGGTWSQQMPVRPAASAVGSLAGWSVALDSGAALIGAPSVAVATIPNAGNAYRFDTTDTLFTGSFESTALVCAGAGG